MNEEYRAKALVVGSTSYSVGHILNKTAFSDYEEFEKENKVNGCGFHLCPLYLNNLFIKKPYLWQLISQIIKGFTF